MIKEGSISETAQWIAAWRAQETLRPDAIFRDPLAARLAALVQKPLPKGVPSWPMVTRTRLIDDLITGAVAGGVDRVLNLAAGLDTRPYRLELPATLRWIEADLPDLIDAKSAELANERPRCQLSREKVDLSDARARAAFLEAALAGAKNALVLTEGLLVYLEEASVRSLADALFARPEVKQWVLDLASPGIVARMKKKTDPRLDLGDRMKFAPANGVAFYEASGWKTQDVLSMFRAAGKFRRLPFPLWLFKNAPDPDPRKLGGRPYGAIVRLVK